MRGKGYNADARQAYDGITPAHAGKSYLFYLYLVTHRDHPRPCGEKLSSSFISARIRGSPPPMRGKVDTSAAAAASDGITPAHAGKSVV